MLLCCLRRTLKPSASAIAISKLYQHFRVRDHPYGLQDSLPTLNPSCSQLSFIQLRHGSKARYGWVANPYRKSLLISSRQGLSPCKIRRAFLGAITPAVSGSQGFHCLFQNDRFSIYSKLPKRLGPGCPMHCHVG